MRNIKLEKVDTEALAPLYHRYQCQSSPQRAFIELDLESATLGADFAGFGDGVPFSVVHGHILRFDVPADVNAEELNALLEELLPLAQVVLNGYTAEYDGSNLVAHITEEAEEAEAQITEIVENYRWDCLEGIIYSWSEWFVNGLPEVIDALEGTETSQKFDENVKTNVEDERYLVDTDKNPSEWALEYIDGAIEDDDQEIISRLPQWVKDEISE